MNVIPLLVLCSLALSAAGVLLFVYSARHRDHEHADRLALLPLEEDLVPGDKESMEFEKTSAEPRLSARGAVRGADSRSETADRSSP